MCQQPDDDACRPARAARLGRFAVFSSLLTTLVACQPSPNSSASAITKRGAAKREPSELVSQGSDDAVPQDAAPEDDGQDAVPERAPEAQQAAATVSNSSPPSSVPRAPPVLPGETPASDVAAPPPNRTKLLEDDAVRPSTTRPSSVDDLFAQAEEEGQRLVENFPEIPDAYEVQARLYWLSGRHQAAGKVWETVLAKQPNYAYAQHGLGQVAGKQGDFEKAVLHHQRAAELMPDYTDAVYHAAGALTQLGHTEAAAELLQSFASRQPQLNSTWIRLGQAWVAEGNYRLALDAFAQALGYKTADELDLDQLAQQQFANGQDQALYGLALCLAREQRLEQARAVQQILANWQQQTREERRTERQQQDDLQRHSREVAAKFEQAGRIYLAMKDVDSAERLFKRAAVLDPQNVSTRVQLASVYMGLMQAEPAAEVCAELVRIEPDNVRHHMNHGMMRMRMGQPARAVECFAEGMKLQPDATGFAMLAQAHAAAGDLAAAVRSIDEALQLEPENAQLIQLRNQWQPPPK